MLSYDGGGQQGSRQLGVTCTATLADWQQQDTTGAVQTTELAFDTVSVAKGVEGVLARQAAGGHIGDHDRPGLCSHKGVPQHLHSGQTQPGLVFLLKALHAVTSKSEPAVSQSKVLALALSAVVSFGVLCLPT